MSLAQALDILKQACNEWWKFTFFKWQSNHIANIPGLNLLSK